MELIQLIGRGIRVKLKADGERLAPGTHKAVVESVSLSNKGNKVMAQVFDKYGKEHKAVNFVICVDEGNTSLLTQGKVYANLGSFGGQYDNLWVIDDRGIKQNFSKERFAPFVKENLEWARAAQPKVNLTFGKLYRVSKTKDGTGSSAPSNQIYCVDDTGSWMVYGCAAFERNVRVTFSEQYLTAKMKAAYGNVSATGRSKGGKPVMQVLALDFNALERRVMTDPVTAERIEAASAAVQEQPIRYVQVRFEDEGKLYTYKHRGEVYPGDEAVVRVENRNYPELCGTKVVEVVNVLDHNPTHFDLKWLVSVVNLDMYRARQQAEENLKAAEAALDKRVQQMMRGEMLKMMAERDPEVAMLLTSIEQLKSLL